MDVSKLIPRWLVRRTASPIGRVVSFPKSGRTWLRVLLDDLGLPLTYTHADSGHRHGRHFSQLPSPSSAEQPTVLLIRNPLDTLVSGYFQAASRLRVFDGSIADFCRNPHHGIEKIVHFNLMWLRAANSDPRMMVVTYEGMKRDLMLQLQRIHQHLAKPVPDPARLQISIRRASFERMQQNEAKGKYAKRYAAALSPRDRDNRETYKVRRGVVGGYVDYLSQADIAHCEAVLNRYQYHTVMDSLLGDSPSGEDCHAIARRAA